MNFKQLRTMNLSDLFRLMKSDKGLIKGPYASSILWGVLLVLSILTYFSFVFIPQQIEIDQTRQKIATLPMLEQRNTNLDLAIRKALNELSQSEKRYEALNQLFAVDAELEDLYKRLSQMADSQRLLISALTTDGEVAVYAGGKELNQQQGSGASTQPPVVPPATGANKAPPPVPLFYRIKLKIELTGTYNQYMKYRRMLADFDKSLNIDKEQITVIQNATGGLVQVKAQVSTIRLAQKLQLPPAQKSSGGNIPTSKMMWEDFQPVFIKISDLQTGTSSSNSPRQNERDPFSRASSGMIEGGRDPRISPLIMADPQSYVITGVLVSAKEKAAMIRTDFRENFVVRIGDRLGNQGGRISEIDQYGIVIRQNSEQIRLYLQTQTSHPAGMDPQRALSGR